MAKATVLEIGELLKDCTAKLISRSGSVTKVGTGFFIAPGKLLTCLHVVDGSSLEAEWRGGTFTPQKEDNGGNKRDLALLTIPSPPDHPCCVVSDAYPYIGEPLVAYGYTDPYPLGDSGSYECEGISNHGVDGPLLKVKAGQAFEGMSGGPLVRLNAGEVCAVMATQRLNTAMGGARAVPIDTAFKMWPDLKELVREDEPRRERWRGVFGRVGAQAGAQLTGLPDAIEFNVPKEWRFRDVAAVMAQAGKSVCDYEGFSREELNAQIQSRPISTKTLAEALEQLRLMTVQSGAIRRYEVSHKGSMYLLSIVKEDEG